LGQATWPDALRLRSRRASGRRVTGEQSSQAPAVQAAVAVSEPALVDAAIAGDGTAFAALYDLHLDRVYRHVYYRVGNRADAEDLTQQVFLQAWRAIGRYRRTAAPFIAWLLTIAHNAIVSHYRKARELTLVRRSKRRRTATGAIPRRRRSLNMSACSCNARSGG
jgi:hypothetical protein